MTGGEHGANGFVAAHDQETGKEVWRFWTVPKPGEPGSETWQGKDIEHGGAPTWFTGSYDPDARHRLLADRQSRARNTTATIARATTSTPTSILALDRKTGTLKWHYQFTPHDLWDWDATQTSVLVDADWQGQPRKLMLHANRNGFFYVFDRRDGTLLLAKPFIKHLTWASGIGADGRPIKLPNQEPSPAGTKVCPSQDGATNWYLAVVQSGDRALLHPDVREVQHLHEERRRATGKAARRIWADRSGPRPIRSRSGFCGRSTSAPARSSGSCRSPGRRSRGAARSRPPRGLVIFGEDGGALMAADAVTGKPLWSFPDQPDVEGVADDLHVRRQAVHRGRGGREHHGVWDSIRCFRLNAEATKAEATRGEEPALSERIVPASRRLLARTCAVLRFDDQCQDPIQFALEARDAGA